MNKTKKLFHSTIKTSFLVSPATKNLLLQYPNISINDMKPTGKGGYILTKQDFFNYLKNSQNSDKKIEKSPQINITNQYKDVFNTEAFSKFAKQVLKDKKNIPHYNLTLEVKVDGLLKLQKDKKVSLLDIIVSRTSKVLSLNPDCNFYQNKEGEFVQQKNVNLSIPLTLKNGTIFNAILKDLNSLNLEEIPVLLKKIDEEANKKDDYVQEIYSSIR
jgi:pyruvate/2-oxoglutarate dehydrogenase complex dihydrolipoamide acyltransferase (E2) component